MLQRHTRSRVRLLLGSILILLFASLFFLPEIVSTYWHLRFGNSTVFHGWTVPVPRGWAAFTRGDIFIIQKVLRFYDSEDAPTISLDILSPGKPVDPERLKQASIRVISEKGYVFREERPIQIAAHLGYCLHFTTGKDQKKIRISCDSLSAELSVDYFGRSSEIETFYSVVGQIRHQDMH